MKRKWKFCSNYFSSPLQINEKGQLRLSRKALLPDPSPDQPNEDQSNLTKDVDASRKALDKSKPKKILSTMKPTEEKNAKNKSTDENLAEKSVKRLGGSSAKDGTYVNKERSKSNSGKPFIRKNESTLVNGEAKVWYKCIQVISQIERPKMTYGSTMTLRYILTLRMTNYIVNYFAQASSFTKVVPFFDMKFCVLFFKRKRSLSWGPLIEGRRSFQLCAVLTYCFVWYEGDCPKTQLASLHLTSQHKLLQLHQVLARVHNI